MKIRELFKNFAYTISSNFISLAISMLVVLIVPKFIGVRAYGYWQLYIFYTTYVGVLHFGWLDGIYLRFGGAQYYELDKRLFFSQFIELCIFQIFVASVIIICSMFVGDPNRSYILIMTAIASILINLRQFCLYILQDTGRIQEYSIISIIGRIFYFMLVLLLLLIKVQSFKFFVLADIMGRILSLGYAFYTCRDIIFQKLSSFFWSLREVWTNLSVGVKLLLANFAGSLIIGVVRYGIQYFWGVKVFGKISLTLNISNLLLTFISAISLVLYPALRRMNKSRLKNVYLNIREILMSLLFIGLLLYYPISFLLPLWLPKYKDSLVYMSLLFPMCIFSGKFSLLISTFMQTFRFERDLLRVNLISVGFSILITLINILFIKQLTVLMFCIVFILWIQSSLGEYVLSKKLVLQSTYKLLEETVMVLIFMISNWYFGFVIGLICYSLSLSLYLLMNRKRLNQGIKYLMQNAF
ncbi:hypothetical protein GA842_03725 [Pediococcus parvulus]|uniref:Flippase n=1 Tax=Pediococcus parvulus TaxID=54062 RepID=A0AAP5TA75_9LACO|nr:hypothetical protein [Pediococcus parvulus]MDV7694004.1 hypothetical protein [Pediococcus parvulus]